MRTGLITGLGTGRTGLNPSDSVIPQTLDGIANASDPLQAFADACGMSFKVDYLWIGNELVGATELGGSGLDLVNTGVTQEQADARLGAGNVCTFDASADTMSVASASLDIGTGSVAIINIDARDAGASDNVVGKFDATTGYIAQSFSTGHRRFLVRTSSGTFTATVAIDHGTTGAVFSLSKRSVSTNEVLMHTNLGDASGAEATITTATTTSDFAVGKVGPGANASANMAWGLTAFVKGANAELVTAAHRANLQTWLGF